MDLKTGTEGERRVGMNRAKDRLEEVERKELLFSGGKLFAIVCK